MRSLARDALNRIADAGADGDGPVRSCVLTRDRAPAHALVRLALGPDNGVHPDVRAKAPGRGAWIGVTRPEMEAAYAKGRLRGVLARALRAPDLKLDDDLPARVAAALERAALDRLGLEARGSNLLTGAERIEKAARSGTLHALYHAADAGDDGARRLAQAWRVGREEEGTGLKGLVLPVDRPILSVALGRENVVHIGVTDRAAARRLGEVLGRWLHFIGFTTPEGPCGTAPQGASAPGSPGADATAEILTEDTE